MQARTAARELALILFSQLNEKIKNTTIDNIDDMILKSVRILKSNANDELKISLTGLMNIKDSIQAYQAKHETNLKRPLDASDVPVELPMTDEILNDIETVFDVSDKALMALNVAEIATLSVYGESKNYVVELINTVFEHKKEIDDEIQKYSVGWDINRIYKMDKDILRIAITEILFIDKIPYKVAVDEAVELSKKYSTKESPSFINGILSKVIFENGVE